MTSTHDYEKAVQSVEIGLLFIAERYGRRAAAKLAYVYGDDYAAPPALRGLPPDDPGEEL